MAVSHHIHAPLPPRRVSQATGYLPPGSSGGGTGHGITGPGAPAYPKLVILTPCPVNQPFPLLYTDMDLTLWVSIPPLCFFCSALFRYMNQPIIILRDSGHTHLLTLDSFFLHRSSHRDARPVEGESNGRGHHNSPLRCPTCLYTPSTVLIHCSVSTLAVTVPPKDKSAFIIPKVSTCRNK